jgi:hypothetical protein
MVPASAPDVIGRLIAQSLAGRLDHSGASGNLATEGGRARRADGYTLLLVSAGKAMTTFT